MSQFRKLFEGYGGDYEATMARFIHNEKMYMKFLDMLFKDENLQNLGDALNRNDLRSAFEAAHTLKGVVGNMGLMPLFNVVCEIVEPLRLKEQRADYIAMYQVIQEEFKKVEELREQLKKGE